tara:strand:+ start:651 stop:1262 length:612 start_codon:yes stop_codon:yes gene_type:complete
MVKLTAKDLLNFEEDIASEFNNSNIKAPVHLYNGNEQEMIDVFSTINNDDWVLCTWRSHYQCLLKGVPKEIVKEKIMSGGSMALCFPDYNIFSSAIVTGILPIAVGLGLSLKRRQEDHRKVHCFVGDMTALTGSFNECLRYCEQHDLPVRFIIEDNGRSVCTTTSEVWNYNKHPYLDVDNKHIVYYKYESKWPHAGAGKRVQF